jgi:signal transduction histidine kinase
MRLRSRPLGLRAVVTLAFAALALVVSAILAGGTYLTARQYLLGQREQVAARQAFADASVVREGLLTTGSDPIEVLASVAPGSRTVVLLRREGEWYSSSLRVDEDAVPAGVREHIGDGGAAVAWARLDGSPVLVVGVPLPAVDAHFYEIVSTSELDSTLVTLSTVLAAFAVLTTLGGTLGARALAARAITPLDTVAGAAAQIAAGQMDTRLPPTDDPDLSVIVGSFNTMVEALDERIRRDARFAADVSHELRSPVTTLTTSVEVLVGARDELPPRSRRALELVETEVLRLRRSLEHLLELGRIEAGVVHREAVEVDLAALVEHALAESHRPVDLLAAPGAPVTVRADKQELNRALVNLFDNADLHGDGLVGVSVLLAPDRALVAVDDAGPGVAADDRERVFERFARSGSRGSRAGTGLGLSLVRETARAHGGAVWCEESPQGGARFVLALPLAEEPA